MPSTLGGGTGGSTWSNGSGNSAGYHNGVGDGGLDILEIEPEVKVSPFEMTASQIEKYYSVSQPTRLMRISKILKSEPLGASSCSSSMAEINRSRKKKTKILLEGAVFSVVNNVLSPSVRYEGYGQFNAFRVLVGRRYGSRPGLKVTRKPGVVLHRSSAANEASAAAVESLDIPGPGVPASGSSFPVTSSLSSSSSMSFSAAVTISTSTSFSFSSAVTIPPTAAASALPPSSSLPSSTVLVATPLVGGPSGAFGFIGGVVSEVADLWEGWLTRADLTSSPSSSSSSFQTEMGGTFSNIDGDNDGSILIDLASALESVPEEFEEESLQTY